MTLTSFQRSGKPPPVAFRIANTVLPLAVRHIYEKVMFSLNVLAHEDRNESFDFVHSSYGLAGCFGGCSSLFNSAFRYSPHFVSRPPFNRMT